MSKQARGNKQAKGWWWRWAWVVVRARVRGYFARQIIYRRSR